MITLTAHEVTPAMAALFDLSQPTMPRAFNVLEGTTRGQIVVDDLAQPTWAVVHESTYGTLYLGGEINAPLLVTLVAHFRPLGDVGIGCWRDDAPNRVLPPQPHYDSSTLYFTDRSRKAALQSFIDRLPFGYTLAQRDERLFRQSFDHDATLTTFGTVENVLRLTLGVVLLHGGVVLCEAATGAPTHERIEVGVTTEEAFRQRGFATITCASLIALCEARGYTTWWDCASTTPRRFVSRESLATGTNENTAMYGGQSTNCLWRPSG